MKKILLAAATIALLASCTTRDEVVKVRDNSIRFQPKIGNTLITKAEISTINTLGVSAFRASDNGSYFDNLPLAFVSTAWTLTPTQYWPQDGENKALNFWAYSPYFTNNVLGIQTAPTCEYDKGHSISYIVTGVAGFQTDLMASQAALNGSEGNAVALALKHILTKVDFKAQLSASPNTSLTVKISEIKVTAKPQGAYANKTWGALSGSATDYTVGTTETLINATNGSSVVVYANKELHMLPVASANTADKATISVTAKAYSDATLVGTKTVKLDVSEWLQGKYYTYIITLDPDAIATNDNPNAAITFSQPTVTDWETGTPGSGIAF